MPLRAWEREFLHQSSNSWNFIWCDDFQLSVIKFSFPMDTLWQKLGLAKILKNFCLMPLESKWLLTHRMFLWHLRLKIGYHHHYNKAHVQIDFHIHMERNTRKSKGKILSPLMYVYVHVASPSPSVGPVMLCVCVSSVQTQTKIEGWLYRKNFCFKLVSAQRKKFKFNLN